jgi:hypothetical protein
MKTRIIQDEPEPTGPASGDATTAARPGRLTNLPGGNPALCGDEEAGDDRVADDPGSLEPDSNGGTG